MNRRVSAKRFIAIFTLLSALHLPISQGSEDDELLLLVPSIIAKRTQVAQKPGPKNTGFKHTSSVQTLNESIIVEVDNTIIKDIDLSGCITVKADNVRIQNVRIHCTGFYGIRANDGHNNLVIEDVEIFGMQSSGILGSDFILRRANIHDSGSDAVKPRSNVIIESSYFHRLGTKPNSHSDGVQMVSGGNVIIRNNTFDMPFFLDGYTNSQCMIIQTNNGPIDNINIEGNWFNGGGYCVQINDKGRGHGPPTNVHIRGNRFGPDCQFGILRFRDSSPQLDGNIYEDSGLPINADHTLCGNEQP